MYVHVGIDSVTANVNFPTLGKNLFQCARDWSFQYNQARASALMDEAEEQAKQAGEREDKWEEEKSNLKEEMSQLRDQLTAGVGGQDQETRTLRAEIDSLREENADLKHQVSSNSHI